MGGVCIFMLKCTTNEIKCKTNYLGVIVEGGEAHEPLQGQVVIRGLFFW